MAKAGTFLNYGEIATTFDCRPVQNRVVWCQPGQPIRAHRKGNCYKKTTKERRTYWKTSLIC